jgi:hypothetical protein
VRTNYDEDYGIIVSMAILDTAIVMMAAYEFCELEA